MAQSNRWVSISTIVLTSAWVALLWAVLIVGIAIGNTSFHHFTIWAWCMNIVFYTAILVSYWSRKLHDFIIYWFFWLIHGVTWLVFVGISVVLFENPILLDTEAHSDYGQLALGIVLLGEKAFHVFPVIAIMYYAVLHRGDMTAIESERKARWASRRRSSYWLVTMLRVASPLVPWFAWAAIFDAREVYGVTIHPVFYLLLSSSFVVSWNAFWMRLLRKKMVVSVAGAAVATGTDVGIGAGRTKPYIDGLYTEPTKKQPVLPDEQEWLYGMHDVPLFVPSAPGVQATGVRFAQPHVVPNVYQMPPAVPHTSTSWLGGVSLNMKTKGGR